MAVNSSRSDCVAGSRRVLRGVASAARSGCGSFGLATGCGAGCGGGTDFTSDRSITRLNSTSTKRPNVVQFWLSQPSVLSVTGGNFGSGGGTNGKLVTVTL